MGFTRTWSIVGLSIAVVGVLPYDLGLLLMILGNHDARARLLGTGNAVAALVAVAAIGWMAGRTVARRHLRRLGPLVSPVRADDLR